MSQPNPFGTLIKTDETLQSSCVNANEVPLDISQRGFWQIGHMAFFYLKVVNSNTKRCLGTYN